MRRFGEELRQNKNMMPIDKKIAVLLSFIFFAVPCYASELQGSVLNTTVIKDSDGVYFPKFVSFGAQGNLFYLEDEIFEVNHCPYILENGMIMIPLRDLFEVIQKAEEKYELTHCSLIWHESTKQIECRVGQRTIMIWINDNKFSINGEEARALEYSLANKENTIYISLKDIAPMLGNSFSQNFYDIENNRFGVWI